MASHLSSVKPNASSQALAVPELLVLVCSFLNKKDCAACLCIFRHTFASIASIVWEEIDLKSILLLVPGMQVTKDKAPGEPYFTFEFPATVDLARFEAYRSFVKAISTSIPYTITFPKDWPSTSGQAPLRPLLPNLQSITINTFGWVPDRYVDWVPRLLTPDLKEFKMYSLLLEDNSGADPENAWLNPSKCIELIDAISRTCSAIKTLEIFAQESEAKEDKIEYNVLCEKVAGLHSLRSLSFSGANAGETLFRAFGRLPHLEYLSLVSDTSQMLPGKGSPVILSDDSFPALQHLALRRLYPNIITRVYDSPQLFGRLVSAEIVYDNDDDSDGDESCDLRSAYAMRCLSHGCSNLANLSILTEGGVGFFCVFRRFIPIFKQMPLRCLRLCSVDLNPELSYLAEKEDLEENDPKVTWEEFFTGLPHLEELVLNNLFNTKDLMVLADLLPKLCYFSPRGIQAPRTEHAFSVTTRSTTTQPIIICCNFYLYKYADEPAKRISQVARETYEIWPNVEFKAYGNDAEWAKRAENQLNEVIRALRLKE